MMSLDLTEVEQESSIERFLAIGRVIIRHLLLRESVICMVPGRRMAIMEYYESTVVIGRNITRLGSRMGLSSFFG